MNRQKFHANICVVHCIILASVWNYL